jgi:hypothetical protein
MGVAAAREKARAWHALVSNGLDPRAVEEEQSKREEAARLAQAAKKANTFAAYAERYIAGRTNRRAAQDAREIRRLLISEWASRPMHEIAPRDVRQVIDKIKVRAPYDAKNAWTHAVGIFKGAVHEELLEASPCASLDKRLLFKGVKLRHRDRYLSDAEVFALWRAAGRLGYPAASAIRLLILLGVRNNEMVEARWSEFSPELRRIIRDAQSKRERVNWSAVAAADKAWRVPPERFKSESENIVALPDAACEILELVPRFKGCDFVFTNDGTKPMWLGDKLKRVVDRRMLRSFRALARRRRDDAEPKVPGWVWHDLRRTMRTNMSALGIADHVAEMCLGHARKGLQRVYDQHRFVEQMREAREAWAAKVLGIVSPAPKPGAKVIPLTRRARKA